MPREKKPRPDGAEKRETERDLGWRQIVYRIHMHDKIVLSKIIRDDGLSYQELFDTIVQAYMKGDPAIMQAIKDAQEIKSLPKEVTDRWTLSQRQRQALLDRIEKGHDKKQLPKTLQD